MVDFRILITFFVTITSVASERHPNINTEVLIGDDAKQFTSLLQNLIKVNEGRMKSIKALVHDKELPAYPQKFGRVLRTALGANEDRSRGNRNGPDIAAYFVLPRQIVHRSPANTKSYESEKRKDTPAIIEAYRDTLRDNKVANLRASLRSCKNHLLKKCKKTCREAVNNACESYRCRKRLKKKLRKECKRVCKSNFKDEEYSDYDLD